MIFNDSKIWKGDEFMIYYPTQTLRYDFNKKKKNGKNNQCIIKLDIRCPLVNAIFLHLFFR